MYTCPQKGALNERTATPRLKLSVKPEQGYSRGFY